MGKNHVGALYEKDKLLILLLLLLDDWIQKYVLLILIMIPLKHKDFFRRCKGTLYGYSSGVLDSNGLFHRFRACAIFYYVKSSSEIASAGIKTAE